MNLTLVVGPLVSLIAGILIRVMPRLLNYIVALYLIIIGVLGLFELDAVYSRSLTPGELTLAGHDIESGSLDITFTVEVIRPKVQTHFDVVTRGRFISLAPVQHGEDTFRFNVTITGT
jgi:Protein of unknown function (DUF3096)